MARMLPVSMAFALLLLAAASAHAQDQMLEPPPGSWSVAILGGKALSSVPDRAEAFFVSEGFNSRSCGWSWFGGGGRSCTSHPRADHPILVGTLEARYHRGRRLGYGLVLANAKINRMHGFASLPGQDTGTRTTVTHSVRTLAPVATLSNGPASLQLGPALFRTRAALGTRASRMSEGDTFGGLLAGGAIRLPVRSNLAMELRGQYRWVAGRSGVGPTHIGIAYTKPGVGQQTQQIPMSRFEVRPSHWFVGFGFSTVFAGRSGAGR